MNRRGGIGVSRCSLRHFTTLSGARWGDDVDAAMKERKGAGDRSTRSFSGRDLIRSLEAFSPVSPLTDLRFPFPCFERKPKEGDLKGKLKCLGRARGNKTRKWRDHVAFESGECDSRA